MSLLAKISAYREAVRAREAARERVRLANLEWRSAQDAAGEAEQAELDTYREMRSAMAAEDSGGAS